jgi:hypothetical protein
MRKTLIISVFVLVFGISNVYAQPLPIEFEVSIFDNKPVGHQTPKSPIQPPTVYVEDYTLTFAANHPEYVLYIKDENDVVVYSTVVTSAETLVTLPSTLSGEYKIELVMDNWLFTGYVSV